MSLTQKERKLRSRNGETFPPAGDETFTVEMSHLLRRAYGGRHSAVKAVALAIGVNERAVKNWFDGKNGPSAENLLELVVHSDAALVGFLRMAGKQDAIVAIELDRVTKALEVALGEIRKLRPK